MFQIFFFFKLGCGKSGSLHQRILGGGDSMTINYHINYLVFVVLTINTCLLGDYVVFTAFQNQMTIIKALGDSSIHGLVALFSWLIIQNEAFLQAIICAAIAMMIDVDHFIQGKFLL